MCRSEEASEDKTLSSLERHQQVSLFIILLTNIIISSPQFKAGIKKRLMLNSTMAEILIQKANTLEDKTLASQLAIVAKAHKGLKEIIADL